VTAVLLALVGLFWLLLVTGHYGFAALLAGLAVFLLPGRLTHHDPPRRRLYGG
jgi:hypothetical protein